jgi:hypothetical protein
MTTLADVEHAEQELLRLASEKPGYSPRELRRDARNGLPSQTVSLAFWRLLNRGKLELDSRRLVRVAGSTE